MNNDKNTELMQAMVVQLQVQNNLLSEQLYNTDKLVNRGWLLRSSVKLVTLSALAGGIWLFGVPLYKTYDNNFDGSEAMMQSRMNQACAAIDGVLPTSAGGRCHGFLNKGMAVFSGNRTGNIQPLNRVVTASELRSKRDIALYVDQVGAKYGLPDYFMSTMASIESDFNPKAKYVNPKTGRNYFNSATGLYQYIGSTGWQVGLIHKKGVYGFRKTIDDRYDPIKSTEQAAKDAVKHVEKLRSAGVDAQRNPFLLYAAHNQGIDGIIDINRIRNGLAPLSVDLNTLYYRIYKNTSGKHLALVKSQGYRCTRKMDKKTINSYCGKANKEVVKAYLSYFSIVYEKRKNKVLADFYNNSATENYPNITVQDGSYYSCQGHGGCK